MSESNASLADRFAGDDRSAFDSLVDRYHAMVFQLCFRSLGHRQDAEDATQETFSRLAKYLERWDRKRPLEPYLKAIAGNRCRTALAKRRHFHPLDSVAEPQTDDDCQGRRADALREEVHRVLEHLPTSHRNAFELFHQQSLSYAEISRRMNCPVGTVKTWVHRARRELIDQMRRRGVAASPPPKPRGAG